MRPIDADKILEKMESTFDMQDTYLPINFKELIVDEMPTVREAPPKINVRTESEIQAYIDGYNACFLTFCEFLKKRKRIADAVREMQIIAYAVTAVVDKEDTDA